MRKINRKKLEAKWCTFPQDEQIQFLLKPFSLFHLTKLPSDSTEFTSEMFWSLFNEVVVDWKGIEDEDGDIKCDEDNKKIIFDYAQDLVIFVINSSAELHGEVVTEKEAKN